MVWSIFLTSFWFNWLFNQTEKWLDVVIFAQESAISSRRLLLEKAQGRQDDARRSHETQSARHRGETFFSLFIIIPSDVCVAVFAQNERDGRGITRLGHTGQYGTIRPVVSIHPSASFFETIHFNVQSLFCVPHVGQAALLIFIAHDNQNAIWFLIFWGEVYPLQRAIWKYWQACFWIVVWSHLHVDREFISFLSNCSDTYKLFLSSFFLPREKKEKEKATFGRRCVCVCVYTEVIRFHVLSWTAHN